MNCKLYRCGWCGNIVSETGEPVSGLEWIRVKHLIDTYGDYRTVKVNGWCCRHEANY